MARIDLTPDQDEVPRLLADDRGDAFRALLQQALNGVLGAESAEQPRAEPHGRAEGRTDSRNGTRRRPPATRLGTIELAVPRHRNVPFGTLPFGNYQRSGAAPVATMAEMAVAGASTARVGRVMEALCGATPSKSSVSGACGEPDAAVEGFRTRPIEGECLSVCV